MTRTILGLCLARSKHIPPTFMPPKSKKIQNSVYYEELAPVPTEGIYKDGSPLHPDPESKFEIL